jgi:hypothetical protein
MKAIITALFLFLFFSNAALSAEVYYKSYPRAIFIKFVQPVGEARVYLAGRSSLGGGCIAEGRGGVMDFQTGGSVSSEVSAALGFGKFVKMAGKVTDVSTKTPGVYFYNVDRIFTTTPIPVVNLKYNIAYKRNNKWTIRGWSDLNGGCHYDINKYLN